MSRTVLARVSLTRRPKPWCAPNLSFHKLIASLRLTSRRNSYSTQPLIIKVLHGNTGDLFGTTGTS